MADDDDFFASRARDLRERWRASRADFDASARRVEKLTGKADRQREPAADGRDIAAREDRDRRGSDEA